MLDHQSIVSVPSRIREGVSFTIFTMSFGRRVELMRRVRELAARLDYFEAGSSQQDRITANVISAEIDELYVQWGLKEIKGLTVDGEPATPQLLITCGPEDLLLEALTAVKFECGLNEAERKN